MYGESADQAARYVNVLAAGSKEGAADVSAQAASIKNAGVAASGAGVSIEQLQGTIQMLAEKGLEAEPAGTALRKFFLVLQTGPDETNPKVVGLQTALENLNKKSLTAAQIQTMFGEEAYSAATILIDNAERYDNTQKLSRIPTSPWNRQPSTPTPTRRKWRSTGTASRRPASN